MNRIELVLEAVKEGLKELADDFKTNNPRFYDPWEDGYKCGIKDCLEVIERLRAKVE